MGAHFEGKNSNAADSETQVRRDFLDNDARFEEFYALQRTLVGNLARHPALIRAWLAALPPREEGGESSGASKSWRAARLCSARRRTLSDLIAQAEEPHSESQPLADFLLTALPVESYFEITQSATLRQEPVAAEVKFNCEQIVTLRNALFDANYGLAKKVARGRKNYDEMLSAASIGLLAAIDRYVPNQKTSARFGYFANYWILYHVSRYNQKNSGVVAVSINQQRAVRKIDRYLEQRRVEGLPAPAEFEICATLNISPEAYRSYLQRPVMISFDQSASAGIDEKERENSLSNMIAAEDPEPDQALEDSEIGRYVRDLLRRELPAPARVMLSYARRVGSLPDAGEDYLLELECQVLQRVRSKTKIRSDKCNPVSLRLLTGLQVA